MPFKSEAQRKWMHKNHPEMAKEYEKETPKDANLPEHVPKQSKRTKVKKRKKSKQKGGVKVK